METIFYDGDYYIVVGRGPVRPLNCPHARYIPPYAVWGEKTIPGTGYMADPPYLVDPYGPIY